MPNSNDSGELEGLIFQFFSKFSRFEYALKKAEFLQSHVAGARAQADWKPFWE